MTTAIKYKSYPKYKPSDADWFTNIPSGWEAKRLRFLTNLQKGRKPEENTEAVDGLPYLTMDFLRGQEEPTKYAPSQESVVIDDGDILLLWDGANAGEFMKGSKGILSSTVARISFSPKLNSKYYFYFLTAFEKKLRELTIGMGIPHVSGDIVKDCITPIPPVPEQKSIADFLDRETTKIDEVVGKKQKLIELLKEKHQALITRAVTKGLDPKAKMKPSGIDWLGDIPERWESWKISHLFNKIGSGTTPPSENMDYYEGDIPWVITGELRDNEIFDSENKVTKKTVQELSALKIFPKNSLLIAMYGATIGKMAILRIPATTNQACCVLGDSKLIDVDFAFYYFLSFRPHLIALSYGGGQPNISQDTIRSIKIFLPALTKQKEIVAFLDGETAKIDGITKKVETQIEKLQEYRQALITSAVTGKIMVN